MSEHSPLPWFNHLGTVWVHCVTLDNKGQPYQQQQRLIETNHEDAEFIVRACNSYYMMLDCLKEIDNSDMAMREEDEGNVSPILQRVRNIIAKAESI